jgi:hypothetical protein
MRLVETNLLHRWHDAVDDLLLYFQRDLHLVDHWRGRHPLYPHAPYAWLDNWPNNSGSADLP